MEVAAWAEKTLFHLKPTMQRTLLPDLCLNDFIYSFFRTGYLAYILTAWLMLAVPTVQTKTSGSLKKKD